MMLQYILNQFKIIFKSMVQGLSYKADICWAG